MTTPGNAVVHKTKNDLSVECDRDGYQHTTTTLPSHFNGATAGNILAGGIIGLGVDAATGANYNYPDSIDVRMTPTITPQPAGATVLAPAPDPARKPST